jgi:hypothetical protein
MKSVLVLALACVAAPALLHAQAKAPTTPPPPADAPPPVYPAPATPPAPAQVYIYDQKPVTPPASNTERSYLISPEQAQSVINRFKEHYKKIGAPRVIIYVNRDLIDDKSGVKLTSHRRVVETTRVVGGTNQTATDAPRQTERIASTNIFRAKDRKEMTLADKQTVRDIERLFGRPLRMAGVQLADQSVANQLAAASALDSSTLRSDSEQARTEREALAKVADVVLEILVSSKEIALPEGNATAPDVQATAIRLNDSRILGQATAADLIGQGPAAAKAVRSFGIREVAEATALSLMEDMMVE